MGKALLRGGILAGYHNQKGRENEKETGATRTAKKGKTERIPIQTNRAEEEVCVCVCVVANQQQQKLHI